MYLEKMHLLVPYYWGRKTDKKTCYVFKKFRKKRQKNLKKIIQPKKKMLFLVVQDLLVLKGVLFAWIKVVNLSSQFSTEPLEVLTQFQDWELGQSVSFEIKLL